MVNRYSGYCGCGARVAAGAGTVAKVGGKWIVSCERCRPVNSCRYVCRCGHSEAYYFNGMELPDCPTCGGLMQEKGYRTPSLGEYNDAREYRLERD